MPTYDYQCESCGGIQEVFHSMSASGPAECSHCGASGQMRRLMSAGGGLVFKGSGFYITDYKKGGADASEKKTEAKPEAKSEAAKTDTKPAGGCGAGCGCHS